MKSQQHRWKTWLSQVVRHQGGAGTVEWIGLLAIVLVALGVSAFALTQNGNVVGGSFARQFECALRVIGIEGVPCEQLDEAEARGIDVPQQTIDPPPSLPAEEGYECQQGESTIGDDGYLQQTTTCSRVAPDNPKAVETCTATATGQDLWEGEAPPPEYSCETTQVVPEPLEGYECTETTSMTADGDQQFDQDCWRVSPDDPGSVEECHNSTVVNAQSLANDTSWNCETQRVAPEPLPAEEGWECNDSTDGNQLTQTCEKREENGDETTITTCTSTTVVQPGGESSGWDCEAVVEREEEKCEWSWNIFKMIWNCTTEYVVEPIAEHVIEPFLGALEDVWEVAKAFLTGEFQALIGIIEGIIEFFKNPSLDALLKILDSACGSMVLQLIPGGGDALGALCDAKGLIESSMDGEVADAVINALSLLIGALFSFVPGMGDLVGELMDQLTPTIRKLFKSGDEGVDTGTDVARHSDEADEVADGPPSGDSDVAALCDRAGHTGKVRGLAAPLAAPCNLTPQQVQQELQNGATPRDLISAGVPADDLVAAGRPLNNAEWRQLIDNPPPGSTADDMRYQRYRQTALQEGRTPSDRTRWDEQNARLRENSARGRQDEDNTLNELGVQNNNYNADQNGQPRQVQQYTASNGETVRPDGVSSSHWIDVKSTTQDTYYYTKQLQAQAEGAAQEGKRLGVVLTNNGQTPVRPSGPLADNADVYYRDSQTGQWAQWDIRANNGQGGWRPITQQQAQQRLQ